MTNFPAALCMYLVKRRVATTFYCHTERAPIQNPSPACTSVFSNNKQDESNFMRSAGSTVNPIQYTTYEYYHTVVAAWN